MPQLRDIEGTTIGYRCAYVGERGGLSFKGGQTPTTLAIKSQRDFILKE